MQNRLSGLTDAGNSNDEKDQPGLRGLRQLADLTLSKISVIIL